MTKTVKIDDVCYKAMQVIMERVKEKNKEAYNFEWKISLREASKILGYAYFFHVKGFLSLDEINRVLKMPTSDLLRLAQAKK